MNHNLYNLPVLQSSDFRSDHSSNSFNASMPSNSSNSSNPPILQSSADDEINLFELVEPLLKNRNFIAKWTIYAFFISALITLLMPSYYQSTARILPPQTQSSISQQLMSQFSGLAMLSGGGALKDTSALYTELLKTNGVLDYVIDQNNLRAVYRVKCLPCLRKAVAENLTVESDKKSGIMTIGYIDRKPRRSFEITGSFIEGLKKINNELAITEASQRRLFYEEQLKTAGENLINAEEDMKRFQQRTGSIKIDEEAKASIEEASLLRARISAKEVQMKVLEGYATRESTEYKNLQNEIAALREQLSKFQSRTPSDDDSIFSTRKASVYGIEFIRKTREFKYNEALYEILLKQYEAAKLDESKDNTVIQIVEKPEIPTKRFSPQRRKIVVKWTFIAFFFAAFFVFISNFYENLRDDSLAGGKIRELEKSLNLKGLKADIQSDWNKVKSLLSRLKRK